MAYSCPPGTRQLAAGRAQSVVEWSRLATYGRCLRTLTSQLKATPRLSKEAGRFSFVFSQKLLIWSFFFIDWTAGGGSVRKT